MIKYFIKYYETLKPRVYLCYDRTAYFSVTDRDLRITFDRNILWRRDKLDLRYDHYGTDILKEGQSLMEIKSGTAMPLWLVDIINKSGFEWSAWIIRIIVMLVMFFITGAIEYKNGKLK